MKAVILAAGKGSRLAPLTDITPKPLLALDDSTTLLGNLINSLPQNIDQILVIVKYKKEAIIDYLNQTFPDRNISCFEQGEKKGTYGALVTVKKHLEQEKSFLVLNGDDLYCPQELGEFCSNQTSAFGLQCRNMPKGYYAVRVDSDKNINGFREQTKEEEVEGALVATGAYILVPQIFDCSPVEIYGNEYGLPQTIVAAKMQPKAFIFNKWQPVNTPEDLEEARQRAA